MRTSKKMSGIAVLTALLILGAGWILGVQPQLTRVSSANASRAAIDIQNAANEKVLSQLKVDYRNIGALRGELMSLESSVPSRAGLSDFIAEVGSIAKVSNVSMKSISIDDAKPYTPNVGGTNSPDEAVIANSKITATNFILIPMQIAISGNYSKVLDFIHSLQTAKRLFLISNLGSSKSNSTPDQISVDSTISGYIYVLLGS